MKNSDSSPVAATDSPPRLPHSSSSRHQQRIRKLAGATNEAPNTPFVVEPEEERITSPPLEIFVQELSVSGLLEASTSAMTDITFENSCSFHLSGLSAASSMSSLGDHNISIPKASGDGGCEEALRRLPPRGQSSCSRSPQKKRGGRKGVMRWASMPNKQNAHHHRGAAPDAPPCTCGTENSPRIPRRRGSGKSLSSETTTECEQQQQEQQRKGCDGCRVREKPRLPLRKRSSGSLFDRGGSLCSATSSTDSDDVIVSAANAA